jgi:hypothetical protein
VSRDCRDEASFGLKNGNRGKTSSNCAVTPVPKSQKQIDGTPGHRQTPFDTSAMTPDEMVRQAEHVVGYVRTFGPNVAPRISMGSDRCE